MNPNRQYAVRSNPTTTTWWRCLCLVVAFVACGSRQDAEAAGDYSSLQKLDTARVRLVTARDTTTLRTELARTSAEQTMGLMERQHLDQDAGMLFLYATAQPADAGFWMFRTRIPLDIAFVDSAGVIRSIKAMTPCESTLAQGCPTYPPGAPYRAALEVNAGYFAARHIAVGDRVLLQDTVTSHP